MFHIFSVFGPEEGGWTNSTPNTTTKTRNLKVIRVWSLEDTVFT